MKVEQIPTEKLIPYARNAKKHDAAQVSKLAGSIREFGFNNPVLIDAQNGIIAGHGRVMAAQKLELKDVPCIRLGHLTNTQRRAYILADNRLAELGGGWDEELLKLEIKDIDWGELKEISIDDFNFGEIDFEEEKEEPKSDVDAEPQIDKAEELRAKWGVEPGQLWELGDHRLLCGDSTIPEHVAKLMQGEKANCMVTDPPYGIGIAANPVRQKHTKSDWDKIPVEPKKFVEAVSQAIVWGGNYFNLPPAKGFFVWDKKQPENLTLAMCEMAWTNINTPAKMFRKSVTSYSKEHPTQKPVELIAWCISYMSGDVFDPFVGSGTTIIACEQLGRKCRAIEISPAYVAVAIQRWADATGKTPRKL